MVGVIAAASVSIWFCEQSFLVIPLRVITTAIRWIVVVIKITTNGILLGGLAGSLSGFLLAVVSLARSSCAMFLVLAMMF